MLFRFLVAGRLRQIRQARGLSLAALAARTKITRSEIGRVETGERALTALNLRRLCESLDVSADYLIGLSDDPTPRRKPPA